jgi:hypothetical protein
MASQDVWLFLMVGLLSLLAMAMGFLIVLEAVEVLREIWDAVKSPGDGQRRRPPGDTGPLRRSEVKPQRDAATVRRVIRHFEGKDEGGTQSG